MWKRLSAPLLAALVCVPLLAEVPEDIYQKLVAIGRVVAPADTGRIYSPLHAREPYAGVTVKRDISFGPAPQNVLDVLMPEKGGGNRPVLIFVSGGAGVKKGAAPDQDFASDNIALWAVKNGMTGVLMQRRPGEAWDDPAKDVGKLVDWVRTNIKDYKGNPQRVFLWAQSAGTIPTATYLGHSEFWGPAGVGLKGVILMSGPAFNILPLEAPRVAPPPGQGAPQAGAPKGGAKDGGKKGGPQADPATLLARSNLPGLQKGPVPLFLMTAELDPPGMTEFYTMLKDELCKAGHCPELTLLKRHSHISEVYSVNTKDETASGPVLKWIKSVK